MGKHSKACDGTDGKYFDDLKNEAEFMDGIGVAYWDVPEAYGVHLPLVAVDLEFERPVRVGDALEIAVEPDLGIKSLGFDFTAAYEDDSTAYVGHERHVRVSTDDDRSRPLPEDYDRHHRNDGPSRPAGTSSVGSRSGSVLFHPRTRETLKKLGSETRTPLDERACHPN